MASKWCQCIFYIEHFAAFCFDNILGFVRVLETREYNVWGLRKREISVHCTGKLTTCFLSVFYLQSNWFARRRSGRRSRRAWPLKCSPRAKCTCSSTVRTAKSWTARSSRLKSSSATATAGCRQWSRASTSKAPAPRTSTAAFPSGRSVFALCYTLFVTSTGRDRGRQTYSTVLVLLLFKI